MSSHALLDDEKKYLYFLRKISLMVGGAGTVGCIGLAAMTPSSFWPTYLVAVLFVLGISLGCLGLSLLHQMTGGQWGFAIARNLVAGTAALPLALLFIVPLVFGAGHIYSWLDSTEAVELLNRHQRAYFNLWAWGGRAIIYSTVWGLLSWMVVSRYGLLSRTGLVEDWFATPRISALGLIALSLTTTFAMIDWVMSLDPRWMSTIYSAIVMMGFVVSSMAFVLVMQLFPQPEIGLPVDAKSVKARALDLGNLLMAFLLLWVYFAASQFLIIWSGDLPVETTWYQRRLVGIWPGFGLLLILFHFIIPFGSLLSRDVKTSSIAVAAVAGDLLVLRVVDMAWTILPACRMDGYWWTICLPVALIAVCGLWFGVFLSQRAALPPLRIKPVTSASNLVVGAITS